MGKKRIVKKVLPEYFQDILDNKKKYELRLNDFDVNEGDILVLKEYTSTDPATRKPTGRTLEKEVTYLRKSSYKIYGGARKMLKTKVYKLFLLTKALS